MLYTPSWLTADKLSNKLLISVSVLYLNDKDIIWSQTPYWTCIWYGITATRNNYCQAFPERESNFEKGQENARTNPHFAYWIDQPEICSSKLPITNTWKKHFSFQCFSKKHGVNNSELGMSDIVACHDSDIDMTYSYSNMRNKNASYDSTISSWILIYQHEYTTSNHTYGPMWWL